MNPFISLNNVIPEMEHSPFLKPINWQINQGEIWSVIGSNGSGKTLISQILQGKFALQSGNIKYHFIEDRLYQNAGNKHPELEKNIRVISLNATYSLADYRKTYYQQRFNNINPDSVPLVSEIFKRESIKTELIDRIISVFNLNDLMDHRLIQLSSGELRKLMIAKVVVENPRMVIFDNPFIGLDAGSRENLEEIFPLLNYLGFQLIFLVPSENELPMHTTHILEIVNGVAIPVIRSFNKILSETIKSARKATTIDWKEINPVSKVDFEVAVKMENVNISYGVHKICESINWTINKGEKWALLGPNGSGKSTLLSYVFADNPVAYDKNLTLFDRKRGTGESIWEIKQKIGFTSSELHLYYRQKISCIEVVESGFSDYVGLVLKLTDIQKHVAIYFLNLLNLMHLANKPFTEVSSGEQRLLLFARALVKNPDLLILDEPFHGLDAENIVIKRINP